MHGPRSQRRHHAEVLADIARFAGSSLELDDVLDRIVQRAAELTGADRASIWLLDRAGQRLLPSALYGMDAAFTAAWKTRPLALVDESLSREVLETGRPAIVVDAAADPRTDKGIVQFFGDRSILVAPLVSQGRVVGTLFLNHVRTHYRFTDEDVETTTAIANQAAIAIDNARLYGDTRRLAEQLRRSFRHAGEALAAGVDLAHTLRLMVQLAVETVGADGGAIRLLDEAGRGTYVAAAAGAPLPSGAAATDFPLVAAGRPLGAFEIWRRAPPFDAEELDLLGSFAGHARSAIEHARLYWALQEERRRAQQAERTQAEFVSMISHELRTPLALIKGYVGALLHPTLSLPPATTRRFVEGIDAAADRLRRLIDNLLSATRLEAGLFTTHPESLEVGRLLHHARDAVAVLAQGRSIQVRVPEGELWVLGDADQLTQVIENLVSNAMKYAPGDSPVYLDAARRGDRVRISVTDSGPGISPEALDLVFEKFYRVPAAPAPAGEHQPDPRAAERSRPGGMGLGLYICRRIVEAHGGRIWAENAARGGSVFHLELPVGFGSVDEGKAPGSLPDQAADRMRERALAAGASVRGADS